MTFRKFFALVRDAAPRLEETQAVVSGEAAAHLHLAAATRTSLEGPVLYSALAPRRLTAIYPGVARVTGVTADDSPVAVVLRQSLDLFTARVPLAGLPPIAVLSREAVLAQLLAEGALAIALAGGVVKTAGTPPIDVDEVREILKAARLGDRFQPLLELVDLV